MSYFTSLLSLSFTLFLLMDSIGNVPIFLSLLKDLNPKKRNQVIVRELIVALLIIIVFYALGDLILSALSVEQYSVQISGGILLFIIAMKMIFPSRVDLENKHQELKDPFIVPLAVPLVAGPAVLAAVILYANQKIDAWLVVPAIFFAWLGSTIILLSSSFLQRILGKKGVIACERLMGLILTLIAVQLFFKGLHSFICTC